MQKQFLFFIIILSVLNFILIPAYQNSLYMGYSGIFHAGKTIVFSYKWDVCKVNTMGGIAVPFSTVLQP